jgi:hypothetical protein
MSISQGDGWGVGIGLASMIPWFGDMAKLGKLGKVGETIARAVKLGAKDLEFAQTIAPLAKKMKDALDTILASPKLSECFSAEALDQLKKIRTQLDEFVQRLTPELVKGAQEKLSKSRAKQLEELMKKDGTNIHNFKGKGGGKKDFFVDKDTGDIYLKPKDGSGPGEATGYNVSELE